MRGYLNIKVSLGSAKIVKTSEDGNVSGISFTITGNGVNKTVKTGSNGEIVIDNLSPGTYTVTEQSMPYSLKLTALPTLSKTKQALALSMKL